MEKLLIKNKECLVGDSPRLRKYVAEAHVNLTHVQKKSRNECRRLLFLAVRAAEEEKGNEFGYKFEEFIQVVEPGFEDKAAKLAAVLNKPAKKAPEKRVKKPKAPTPEK